MADTEVDTRKLYATGQLPVVGDIVQWDAPKPPVHARIDEIDHNGEVAYVTFLDGHLKGNDAPVFVSACSKFEIDLEPDLEDA